MKFNWNKKTDKLQINVCDYADFIYDFYIKSTGFYADSIKPHFDMCTQPEFWHTIKARSTRADTVFCIYSIVQNHYNHPDIEKAYEEGKVLNSKKITP